MEPKLFERILDQTLGEPKLTERPILVLPVSKYFASVYKICQAMVNSFETWGCVKCLAKASQTTAVRGRGEIESTDA